MNRLSLSLSFFLSVSLPYRLPVSPSAAREISPSSSIPAARPSPPLSPTKAHAPGLIANIISGSSHKRERSYLNDCLGVLTTPIVYEVDLGAARGKSSETHC